MELGVEAYRRLEGVSTGNSLVSAVTVYRRGGRGGTTSIDPRITAVQYWRLDCSIDEVEVGITFVVPRAKELSSFWDPASPQNVPFIPSTPLYINSTTKRSEYRKHARQRHSAICHLPDRRP